MPQPILTVLAFFHKDWPSAYPALRSVLLAAEEAGRHGLGCRLVAVIDRGDARTREQVLRFRSRLDAVHEVDYGDISLSRNHGIARVDTKYFATLDGDDLLDRDWLWKGVALLEEIGGERTVAHAEMRLSFGAERYGRIQVSTDSPLFHPLNLIASWHYAADLIAPTALFRKLPFKPWDRDRNLGAEDWLWTCESIVEGVRHVLVPETAYYYRRQTSHVGLGSLRGFTYGPTRLLEKNMAATLNEAIPSAAIRFADRSAGVAGAQERWSGPPPWLEHSIERACDLDLDLYDLYLHRRDIPLETPAFFPAVNHFYLRLLAQLVEGRAHTVLFCDRLAPWNLGTIEEFLAAHRLRKAPVLDVLLVSLAPAGPACAQGQDLGSDTPWLRLRHADLGAEPAFDRLWLHLKHALIVRFLLQTQPELVVNLDCGLIDGLMAEYGPAVTSSCGRTVRISHARGSMGDEAALLEDWRSLLRAEASYSTALCRSQPVADHLNAYFHGSGLAAVAADAGGSRGATLHAWLVETTHAGSAAADPLLPRPRFPDLPPLGRKPDLSVILPAEAEGCYLNPMLRTLSKAVAEARNHGLEIEIIVPTGRPGPRTRCILASLEGRWPGLRVVETGSADEGAILNSGIAASTGRCVAVLRSAELVSPRWLALALRHCEASGPETIVHPQAVVEYGQGLRIGRQPSTEEAAFDPAVLACRETWTAHALARRELFQRIPYSRTPAGSGLGHAVWHWNCETLASGCRHHTVPGTAVYRRTAGPAGETAQALGRPDRVTLPPSRFFVEHAWLRPGGGIAGGPGQGAPLDWDEAAYLRSYPDVARAVSLGTLPSGLAHYRRHGRREGRLAMTSTPAGWDDAAYLRAHPDVAGAVGKGDFPSGYLHYCLHGRQESRTAAWSDTTGAPPPGKVPWLRRSLGRLHPHPAPAVPKAPLLPRWLDEEMRSLADLEPALHPPSAGALAPVPDADLWMAEAYRSCWQTVAAARPTHILVAPALRLGGAERALELAIQALLEIPGCRPLVICTDSRENLWGSRLPRQCAWLPLPAPPDGTGDARSDLLVRLLLNAGARTLHVFYSQLGWEVLQRHAPALAQAGSLRIFVSIYSVPPATAGLGAGYARYLGPLLPHLTGVLTDNQKLAARLSEICGVPPGKVTVLRHPVAAAARFTGPGAGSNPVLWAGRLDMDKRPDLLRAIAERLPALRFHVYGSPTLDDPTELERLRGVPNIDYRGSFQGFDTIAARPYHCFLYTSRCDGMPNVLLEAMKAGLLVVASDVGGVAEIVDDQTGLLVRAADDPGAYATELARTLADPGHWQRIAANGQRRVASEHTPEAFREGLRSASGYLDPPEEAPA